MLYQRLTTLTQSAILMAVLLFGTIDFVIPQSFPPTRDEVLDLKPYRIIGTNVYDFADLIKSQLNHSACIFRIEGEVLNPTNLHYSLIWRKFGLRWEATPSGSNPSDLLKFLAASAAATNMTAGRYFAMDPTMRSMLHAYPKYETVMVRHVNLRPLERVVLFALPEGRGKINGEEVAIFDFGEPAKKRIQEYSLVIRLDEDGKAAFIRNTNYVRWP